MTELLQFDQQLFHWINGQWQNPFLDTTMPYWRDKQFWIPFYAVAAVFLFWRFRLKALFLLLAVGLTIGISDMTSSRLIKNNVQRLRPCNDEEVKATVHLLVRCGSGYSFTSSHAANHFALAAFLSFTLGRFFRRIRLPLYLWAASIALGQVYVGVHYPLDILGGALLGTSIGFLTAKGYFRFGGSAAISGR